MEKHLKLLIDIVLATPPTTLEPQEAEKLVKQSKNWNGMSGAIYLVEYVECADADTRLRFCDYLCKNGMGHLLADNHQSYIKDKTRLTNVLLSNLELLKDFCLFSSLKDVLIKMSCDYNEIMTTSFFDTIMNDYPENLLKQRKMFLLCSANVTGISARDFTKYLDGYRLKNDLLKVI